MGLLMLAAGMLSGCAAPDPYVAMMQRNHEMIMQMPEGPAKIAALERDVDELTE
jgi:hypothetical protein